MLRCMLMKYPMHLLKLIDVLKKLPGVGTKSAERFAFEMIDWDAHQLSQMADLIAATPSQLKHCDECGCLVDIDACPYCAETEERKHALCVVAMARDVFAIDATHEYKGLYHVL